MSKQHEEWAAILARSRALLAKGDQADAEPAARVEARRRIAAMSLDEPEPEPEPEPKLDTAAVDWASEIDQRIAVALADARAEIMATVAAERTAMLRALATIWNRARQEHSDELADQTRSLRLELAQLESALAELRSVLAAERARAAGVVVDMPNPIRGRTN